MLFICGDTHGNWKVFNEKTQSIMDKNPDEKIDIIVAGDFGYWPGIEQCSLDKINIYDGRLKIYFIPGNHENWWALKELEKTMTKEIIKVSKNIFYCTFGSVKSFNGRNYLFCGGAESIDKNQRMLGVDWFPEETISENDMRYLPDKRIHTVISHTNPINVQYILKKYLSNPTIYNYDPSVKCLKHIQEKYRPKKWYFGHWHTYCSFRDTDCDFVCLDKIDSDRTSIVQAY